MKRMIWVTGLIILLIAGTLLGQTQTPVHLVKVRITSPGELSNLLELGLDMPEAPPLPDGWVQVIVTDEERMMLEQLGYRVEELIHHMQQFYADRLGGRPMGDYMTYSEIVAKMDSIHNHFPNITTEKFSIGQSWENRDLWVMKLSDNPTMDEEEPELFFQGNIHAREVITYTMLIYTMEHLCEGYGIDTMITRLIDSNELFVAPTVNPDGLVYNEVTAPSGGGMWRKNRRDNGGGEWGVDCNRNFDWYWGYNNQGSSPYPSSTTYRGPYPFSEPETQALRDFCISRQFCIIIDNHSYSDVILYPWGPRDFGLTPDSLEFMEIAAAMASQTGYECGTAYQTLSYDVNGVTFDWYYGEQNTKIKSYALGTEIGSSIEGFWPPPDSIPVLCHENYLANLQLLNIAHRYCPDSTDLRFISFTIDDNAGNGNGIVDPGETIDLDVTLENFGMHTTSGISGILTEIDPYVTVNLSSAPFENIGPLDEGSSLTPFRFTVSSSCTLLHNTGFDLHLTASNGYTDTITFDVQVGERDIYYTIDFESGTFSWAHYGASGWADQWHLSTTRANSPVHSWKCGSTSIGEYSDHMDARLESPSLPLYDHSQLVFWHWMESEISGAYPDSAYDGGIVEISVDGGIWTQVEPDGGYPKTTRYSAGGSTPYTGPFAGTPCYAGSFDWQEVVFDLGGFSGDSLRIRFRFGSDNAVGQEGWYVDDVMLKGIETIYILPIADLAISVSGNDVILTWSGGGNPDGYRVYRSDSGGGPFTQIWEGTASNYFDSNALDRAMNFYYVTSYAE